VAEQRQARMSAQVPRGASHEGQAHLVAFEESCGAIQDEVIEHFPVLIFPLLLALLLVP
jgi:hypothetical protein